MSKFYAGIGSRKTPSDILRLMKAIGRNLADKGWILRSGGAAGADYAFEQGAKSVYGAKTEIYLASAANQAALDLAAKFHPAWDACSDYAKRLHARNCFQVLGRDLNTPSKFIICWTPDGSEGETTQATGGTGQAIRIAHHYDIPIFNLQRVEHRDRISKMCHQ